MTAPPSYGLASAFVVRMTGFPVEQILQLGSPGLANVIDQALTAAADARLASNAALESLRGAGPGGRPYWRRVQRLKPLPPDVSPDFDARLAPYRAALGRAHLLAAEAAATFGREFEASRRRLYELASGEPFRHVLLLSSPGLEALTPERPIAPPVRNQHARQREQTWVTYLQRLTTKNETISFFGPSVWGRISEALPVALRLALANGPVDSRVVYLEGWPCVALARRIEEDPEVRPMLCLRLADDLLLEADQVVLLGTGRAATLTPVARELIVEAAKGKEPLTGRSEEIEELVKGGFLVRSLGVPVSHAPLAALIKAVAAWPAGPARGRWLPPLEGLAGLCAELSGTETIEQRRPLLLRIDEALARVGVSPSENSQALYASRLPVNEDCRRAATAIELGAPLVEQLTVDLAPWYELWRDIAGLFATRLFELLRPVWLRMSQNGPVRLPVFLAELDRARIPLGRTGGIGIPDGLAAEIQQAWQQEMGDRLGASEISLTPHDLGFLRRRFQFGRMKAFDWPAPDIQLIASSQSALDAGQWQAVLAEIHPDFVPWTHALFEWNRDPKEFAKAYDHPGHGPALEFASDGPFFRSAHQFNRAPEYTKGWTFTGRWSLDGQRVLRSAEITVRLVDDDLVALDPAGKVLGSLVHTWSVASNTHQLELHGSADHSPRLKVGKVVVQRESWVVEPDEQLRAGAGKAGIEAMTALRGLRRQRGLPEEVFVRAQLPVRMTHHKDAKPIFVSFQNPLLVELLADTLDRYRLFRFTEALPRLDQCWVADAHGHYSCELRLVTVPGR